MAQTNTDILRSEPLAASEAGVVARRAQDIATLKEARRKVIELRELLQRYSTELSYEFASPAAKIDHALALVLLRRELEDEAGA